MLALNLSQPQFSFSQCEPLEVIYKTRLLDVIITSRSTLEFAAPVFHSGLTKKVELEIKDGAAEGLGDQTVKPVNQL